MLERVKFGILQQNLQAERWQSLRFTASSGNKFVTMLQRATMYREFREKSLSQGFVLFAVAREYIL